MARPDCDDGWIKLANELGAALASADLTVGERVALWFALECLYGPGKPRSVPMPIKTIARASGAWPNTVRRSIRSLVALGILEPTPEDPSLYRFVKDYERWRDRPSRPLFPSGRNFAASASGRINGRGVTKLRHPQPDASTGGGSQSYDTPGGSQSYDTPGGVTAATPPILLRRPKTQERQESPPKPPPPVGGGGEGAEIISRPPESRTPEPTPAPPAKPANPRRMARWERRAAEREAENEAFRRGQLEQLARIEALAAEREAREAARKAAALAESTPPPPADEPPAGLSLFKRA